MPGLWPHRTTCDVAVGDVGLDLLERAAGEERRRGRTTNGIRPPLARPAPTPTRSCSAMPTLISRSGNSSRNSTRLLEPTESLQTATMRSSSRASAISSSAKALRQS